MQTTWHWAERASNNADLTPIRRLAGPLSCITAVLVLSCAAVAQGSASGAGHPANPTPPPPRPADANFDQRRVELQSSGPNATLPAGQRDSCLLPPLSAIPLPSVGVADLKVNAKAKKDYLSACNSLKDRKYDNAEESLRRAVDADPRYVLAWVTLGQLLAGHDKLEAAREACERARLADPRYLPSYLCVADVAARSEHWEEVLESSQRALELDPARDPVAYDYQAAALLNLHRLPDAEKSAMKAIEIDHNHIDPRVHFLLAQIYDAEGELTREESELKEFLKFAGPSDAAMVNQYLSELKSREK